MAPSPATSEPAAFELGCRGCVSSSAGDLPPLHQGARGSDWCDERATTAQPECEAGEAETWAGGWDADRAEAKRAGGAVGPNRRSREACPRPPGAPAPHRQNTLFQPLSRGAARTGPRPWRRLASAVIPTPSMAEEGHRDHARDALMRMPVIMMPDIQFKMPGMMFVCPAQPGLLRSNR